MLLPTTAGRARSNSASIFSIYSLYSNFLCMKLWSGKLTSSRQKLLGSQEGMKGLRDYKVIFTKIQKIETKGKQEDEWPLKVILISGLTVKSSPKVFTGSYDFCPFWETFLRPERDGDVRVV
ncbi:hypothetical protein MLD38_010048 [Melastoma candidum]|uniref:Uncharacterized protein n=1 Tax=Melastoma candidum TaxID=119954 RepID=A0ACB9QYK2_9MYRT|nr:hypothetical protein MLD38_010048 [Melastoma candidum]